ncbi:MAG: biopolymer transporter ExbD [Bacteroidetes bacterium]|nr:biopolymer transporter ExbD [Bacteroidota bacterium]
MAIRRNTAVKAEFSMSGLTDIIFLLLIFFMLTSSFVTINALNLHLPKAKGSVINSDPVTVSITANLEYYVNKTKVSFDQLALEIDRILPKVENVTEDSRGSIIISVDGSVSTAETVKVLAIGKQLGAKVILATDPK